MSHQDRAAARERADRVRAFIYACALPLERLARDVDDVARFTDDASPLSPQLRLVRENPSLTAASAAVVDAVVHIWGDDLFRDTHGQRLMTMMAALGPVDAADCLLRGLDPVLSGAARMAGTEAALRTVLAQHPDAFLGAARTLLSRFTLRPLDDASEAS